MKKHTNQTDNEELKQFHCSILMEEVREKIDMLKEYGMSEKEIITYLLSEQSLPKLHISSNYRLLLGEERKEIHMEPLVKAVYLLFLKHPEGIVFKHLPEYREELADIYRKLRSWGLSKRTMQSIEDVTNPLLNSINEKCARIRSAFVKVFDEHLAKNYFITGERGEAKKITLPRDLVEWEEGDR